MPLMEQEAVVVTEANNSSTVNHFRRELFLQIVVMDYEQEEHVDLKPYCSQF